MSQSTEWLVAGHDNIPNASKDQICHLNGVFTVVEIVKINFSKFYFAPYSYAKLSADAHGKFVAFARVSPQNTFYSRRTRKRKLNNEPLL